MDVWDPNDKTTVFSQIKTFIFAPYRALKSRLVSLDPGKRPKNLTKEEWDRMTKFTKDVMYLVLTLVVIVFIAWLTKDLVNP